MIRAMTRLCFPKSIGLRETMRYLLTAILLVLAATLVFLVPAGNSNFASAPRHKKVITLERTVCFGTCPIYKLAIFSDGRVEYEGIQYVKKVGKATGRISRAKVNNLVLEFQNIYYFNLPESFTPGTKQCPQVMTDMPSAITSLTWQGRSKIINHYHGCRGLNTLELLTRLENKIDEVVKVKKWTK
jgi:hypothetical protein